MVEEFFAGGRGGECIYTGSSVKKKKKKKEEEEEKSPPKRLLLYIYLYIFSYLV